ncbi:putative RNA-binding protein with PIN domain [Nocardioides daedukensis]|uniref:Putative RNA-binding protein with PIN domain n=1 Tax=Nocardioides daedukensis TaxID=634462 RepID=A0A7Y9S207_9ACTN|nr:NYN domain-containing protein [Nocardioides daedukensis]NYG58040.1 putative RNA-binding protein with PIN domain [Nocardioides daedukensis]
MTDGVPTPGPMPEAVRSRLLNLASQALPQIADLPASVRKVATFAPARRAKLGGSLIASALETDDEFRVHVAKQVGLEMPALTEAVGSGVVPQAADPVDLAVLLWLNRPEGWVAEYDAVVARLETVVGPVENEKVARLETRLAQADRTAREAKAAHKAAVEELKAENAALRRKLGEARASVRSASTEAEQTVTDAAAHRAKAEAARTTAEAEARRLRTQLEEAQSALAAVRRETRSDRDEATLRARLLLDTLLDAGQGLRRELALPTLSGAPSDRVEADIARAGTRDPSGTNAMGPASPALLEQMLSMPRARLIIDGYNVSKTAWPDSTLEAQRIRLLNGLGPLVARTGAETTVVFDAASQTTRGIANAPRGVKVLFSPEGVIADDVIRDLVDAEPQGRVVVVVSTDQEIVSDVRRAGARAMWSAALIGLLAR